MGATTTTSVTVAICRGPDGRGAPHAPLRLHAGDAEVPVIAEQDARGYHVTNTYADGIVGVSDADRDSAEVDDSPFCAEHRCEIHHWDHAWTTLTGGEAVPNLKLNVWQAEAVAKAMREHTDTQPTADRDYADIELRLVEDDDHRTLIVIRWEDGARLVLGDSYANHFTDVTDRYFFAPIVTSRDAARDAAIDWQSWMSRQSLSMGELIGWQHYFEGLAAQFDLTDEFRENGII